MIGDMYKKYGLLGPLQAYNIVYPVESITCSWQASALHPEYSYLPVLGPGGYSYLHIFSSCLHKRESSFDSSGKFRNSRIRSMATQQP